jgi:glucose/arabinose dehydrogenase
VLPAVSVQLTTVATGLNRPVDIGWRANDARIYIVEQPGKLRIVNTNGTLGATVLDLTGTVATGGPEQGLLGFTFNANGTKLYVDYTGLNGDIHIVEYTMSGDTAGSPRELLLIPHPVFQNHNGGEVIFGPDGKLYIGVGDGGGAGDPSGNAQNLNVLLGKILRIDPTPSGGRQYTIPADNPFANQAGKRGEIWMYGLRNPWRFSFDRVTHDLWIGDVGQELYEEIDHAAPGQKGTNWGWNLREGLHPYNGGAKPPGAQDPVVEKSHADGYCAIIGGFVYHSSAIPFLDGAYVYGDECRPPISALVRNGNTASAQRDLGVNVGNLTSFGESPNGDLYMLSLGGSVYKLVARNEPVGYWEAATDGRVFGYNGAVSCNPSRGAPIGVVGIAGATSGYWAATRNGAVIACDIQSHGSMAGKHLNLPIVGIAGTPTDAGYWMVASDGGIFSFGNAVFRGSTGGHRLNQPIVGMTTTPSGRGYWLVASDGGIFAFGDAVFRGSTGGHSLNAPIVGMAATRTGRGYWLVASDGGLFTFGDAVYHGSAASHHPAAPIAGIARTPSGGGYWIVGADGALYTFGNAHNNGTAIGKNSRIMGIAHDFPHVSPY